MPDDPLTIIDEMAGSCHEMYMAMIRAGFSEYQACLIVAQIIVAGGR